MLNQKDSFSNKSDLSLIELMCFSSIDTEVRTTTQEMLDDTLGLMDKFIKEEQQIRICEYETYLKQKVELFIMYQAGSLWMQQNIDSFSAECFHLMFKEVSEYI